MFLTITLYTSQYYILNVHRDVSDALVAISIYRGIRAYALALVPPMPVSYYHNFAMWDNLSSPFIVTFLVWHADILVVSKLLSPPVRC